jgi:transaldolase
MCRSWCRCSTSPLESILGLLKHPLTDLGLAKFLEDAKKMASPALAGAK